MDSVPAAAIPRVPVEERLFSLVLALLATETGLTKTEILSTVQGYRQRYSRAGDNANLERQFERDKDDIRELGVPLETVESPGDAGNNQNLRYRIPKGAYDLPADITFSAEETALLGLAAMVWREGSISSESRRALLKLRSLGVQAAEPVLAYLPRVRSRDAAFEPLRSALDRHVVVQFDYLKPGQRDARRRTVEPIALIQHRGRWLLHAHDRDAEGTRNFLLRRIVSPVTVTTKGYTAYPPEATERARHELEEIWAARTAELRVEPGSDAETRLSKRRDSRRTDDGALIVHYTDAELLADELAAHGPEVLVVSPPELRDSVRARLLRTAEDHG